MGTDEFIIDCTSKPDVAFPKAEVVDFYRLTGNGPLDVMALMAWGGGGGAGPRRMSITGAREVHGVIQARRRGLGARCVHAPRNSAQGPTQARLPLTPTFLLLDD
jgi:hypothetical protein